MKLMDKMRETHEAQMEAMEERQQQDINDISIGLKKQVEDPKNKQAAAIKKARESAVTTDFHRDAELHDTKYEAMALALQGAITSQETLAKKRREKRVLVVNQTADDHPLIVHGQNQAEEAEMPPAKVLKPDGTEPDFPPCNGDQPEK